MPQPTPPDRALQALSDSIGGARTRRPEDATDPAIPVAATVVLLRDGAGPRGGLEVLMMERPDRGSFAGAWVFPGGKLEAADRGADEGEPEETVARRAAIRETREETGLIVDPRPVVTLSCWDPPPGLALRIRTWFFLATGATGTLAPAPDEVVRAEWIRPADALADHGRGGFTLYPPTWVTLHGLARHDDTASVLGAARVGGIQRFETVARRSGDGPVLLWHGDDEYEPDAPAEASGSRHRLEIGSLPWRYQRS